MNALDLNHRHAVITGGAAGIGFAIAARMLASGARVTLWDRNAEAIATAKAQLSERVPAAQPVHGVVVDVTSDSAVEAAREETLRVAGPVDALVCSAGITGPNVPMVEYPVAAWREVMEINVNGVFLCNRALAPGMVARGWGRIVNIASIAGKEGNPNASAYSASKAAVIGLTKSLGKELAKTGVCVNCVTPAAVKTGMFDQMTPAHIEFMLSKIPMGRFGLVDEIAAMVAWLCTQDCAFTTGAVFDLSGGRAVY
jgi:NAD(P)-dependent dehydrogenase (short-subunit alcohol dehydrogenase family)